MISPDRLFGNPFTDEAITLPRLANFGEDTLGKLTAANTGNRFNQFISTLTPALQALQQQLGNVDTSLTLQKGSTLTNNQVMDEFILTMRTQEGVIANAVGGFNSAGYLQFYPHGLSEYSNATKTKMPVLANRVAEAATAFAANLGEPLTANLQSFETAWNESRTTQQQQAGSVTGNRTERTAAEIDVQLALQVTIHGIAQLFPGDVEQCRSYFDFSLLFAQRRSQPAEIFNGVVVKNETVTALNRSLTDGLELKFLNRTDNAELLVYLAETADTVANGSGTQVKAGKSSNLKLSGLGSGTFLLVKNLSNVNDAAYTLEVRD